MTALYLAGATFTASAQAQDSAPGKPRQLWVNDAPDKDDTAIDEDEQSKKKRKLTSKVKENSNPSQDLTERSQGNRESGTDIKVDMDFAEDAASVADACPGNWESPECLRATSQSALVLISQYGASLEHEGQEHAKEPLKEECAASTAATQENGIPAYALKSAYTVCLNKITDIADETGVKPDPSYLQLMVGAIWCMDRNPQCAMVEGGLRKWAK